MPTIPLRRPSVRSLFLAAVWSGAFALVARAEPLDAANLAALRAHVGEKVEVRGTPTATGVSKSGTVAYLNFAGAHQAVALVFFLKPGQPDTPATEDDLKKYVGKPIVVTGKLEEFKNDLQIKVESLAQIKDAP